MTSLLRGDAAAHLRLKPDFFFSLSLPHSIPPLFHSPLCPCVCQGPRGADGNAGLKVLSSLRFSSFIFCGGLTCTRSFASSQVQLCSHQQCSEALSQSSCSNKLFFKFFFSFFCVGARLKQHQKLCIIVFFFNTFLKLRNILPENLHLEF